MDFEFKKTVLNDFKFSAEKKKRMEELLYNHGPGNGKLLFLPIDQGLEHGPMDFFANPKAKNPEFQFRLAIEGGYSAIACHIGLAEKYWPDYKNKMPLILKVNGKTAIPSDDEAFSPLTSTVADAVRLGATAVGYTLYIGSPAQGRDLAQLCQVRKECIENDLPLVVWSYPRGKAVQEKGDRDSLYSVDYAARVAMEVGADIIKLNIPKKLSGEKLEKYKAFLEKNEETKPYIELENASDEARMKRVVESAGKTFVIVSGGGKVSDKDLVGKTEFCLKAGVTGLVYGRNMWQRPYGEALEMTKKIKQMLLKYA
ncbi:MAG: fructose-bisphosphate aldolase [archaeon]|nr:fructose-bisphosphate aldolase [archaeon]